MSRRAQAVQVQPAYEKESNFKERCTAALCFSWKVFTCIFSHVTLVTLVVCYCIIGAFTFERLEAKNERMVKETIVYIRGNVTEDIWKMTQTADTLHEENWTIIVMEHLQKFENSILTSMRSNGWDGSDDDNKLQWTFSGALFYSIIVITTIGYGHIAPKTQLGKVTTIFYAILGIPLMLLCLSNIGDIMASSFRFIYWRVCCFACTRETKQSRRQRGRTGTIRQRNSARSQLSPTARSIRNSQRSADSGIDPYDTQINHSYSDTELRYNSLSDTQFEMETRPQRPRERNYNSANKNQRYGHDPERFRDRNLQDRERNVAGTSNRYSRHDEHEMAMERKFQGSVRGRQNDRNDPSTSQRGTFRNSRMSKYSDISPAGRSASVPRAPGLRASSLDPKGRGPEMEKEDLRKTPVLCNKYAFEIIDDPKSKRMLPNYNNRSQSLPRHPHNHPSRRNDFLEPPSPPMGRPYYIDMEDEIEIQPVRRSKKRERDPPSSARIMSPMGFVVQRQAKHVANYRDNESLDDDWDAVQDLPPKARPVPIWLCVCLVVGYIIAGAFLFSSWENWSFLDSAYFCFITLTTIGFGDFVPAQRIEKNAEISIALCSIYLLFGIALLAMSFNLVQEEVIANVKSVARRLGILKEEEVDD